jgi:hypothetical protein
MQCQNPLNEGWRRGKMYTAQVGKGKGERERKEG